MGDEVKKELIDPNRKYSGWKIEQKLDEGGFGQVYRVSKEEKDGSRRVAALKAESNEVEGGSAIKLEMSVLMLLNKDGKESAHVPFLFHAAKRKKFCYMIVSLLGENLRTLKTWKKGNETLSMQTWARIALQCLYSIKLVHDVGFIHRDIKPANFMMGRDDDILRSRLVHVLDFGLARSYAFYQKGKGFVARRARGNVEFRGTMRYCSPNVHYKQEQGRHDDLYSMMYVIVELHCGLPWNTTRNKDVLEKEKLGKTDLLNKWLPPEVHPIIPHLAELNCYSRPNYTLIADCFKKLCKRLKVSYATPYDWEVDDDKRKTLGRDMLAKMGVAPEYERSEAFFAADPVGVSAPPPRKRGNGASEADAQRTSEDNPASMPASKSQAPPATEAKKLL